MIVKLREGSFPALVCSGYLWRWAACSCSRKEALCRAEAWITQMWRCLPRLHSNTSTSHYLPIRPSGYVTCERSDARNLIQKLPGPRQLNMVIAAIGLGCKYCIQRLGDLNVSYIEMRSEMLLAVTVIGPWSMQLKVGDLSLWHCKRREVFDIVCKLYWACRDVPAWACDCWPGSNILPRVSATWDSCDEHSRDQRPASNKPSRRLKFYNQQSCRRPH